jgi:predicted O-methyltransferase YrrM
MTVAQRAIAESAHIFTWTGEDEMAWLADHASRSSLIVELGSYMGRTAKLFAVASPGKIICVDHFETAGVRKVFEYFLRDEIASGRVVLFPGKTPDAARHFEPEVRSKVDMLFIDDGHAHEDVVRDITAWVPLMRPGGLICGHDYHIDNGKPNNVAGAVIQMLPRATVKVGSIWSTNA